MTVTGVGFDRDTLEAARHRARPTPSPPSRSGDNSNILAARVARETFGVENVVARIYDPGRAEVYQRLGIPTVATVRWTADQMLRRLLPPGAVPSLTDPSGKVVIAEVPLATGWVGKRISEVESAPAAGSRSSPGSATGIIPGPDTVFQDGDLVHVAAAIQDLSRIEKTFDQPPPAS